MSVEFPVVD
jgi:carotenoid cleavage dioxygenase-like enzyme